MLARVWIGVTRHGQGRRYLSTFRGRCLRSSLYSMATDGMEVPGVTSRTERISW